jgi:hypothetical protein
MKKLLILYCSPRGHRRLRIDKEHRAVDQVARELGVPDSQIVKKQAATLDDLLDALGEDQFEVIQFSGHGNADHLLLDTVTGRAAPFLVADLADIVARCQRNLRLFVSMSCFSYESSEEFLRCSPHVICIDGTGGDRACIEFIERFYKSFFRTGDIQNAYLEAYTTVRDLLNVIHCIRPWQGSSKVWVEVVIGFHCTAEVLVDLSEAKDDIAALGKSRDEFIGILTRKLRVHKDIFTYPREKAYIAIGNYIGHFSWQSRNGVRCHGVYTLRQDLDESYFSAWGAFSVAYYDCTAEEYRIPGKEKVPKYPSLLRKALKHYRRVFDEHFCRGDLSVPGRALMGTGYAFSKAQIMTALVEAETNLVDNELGLACLHLETALSGMHDVMDSISTKLIEKPTPEVGPAPAMTA